MIERPPKNFLMVKFFCWWGELSPHPSCFCFISFTILSSMSLSLTLSHLIFHQSAPLMHDDKAPWNVSIISRSISILSLSCKKKTHNSLFRNIHFSITHIYYYLYTHAFKAKVSFPVHPYIHMF